MPVEEGLFGEVDESLADGGVDDDEGEVEDGIDDVESDEVLDDGCWVLPAAGGELSIILSWAVACRVWLGAAAVGDLSARLQATASRDRTRVAAMVVLLVRMANTPFESR